MKRWMTIKEASELLQKSEEYTRCLIASGLVPKCGRFQREGASRAVYHINRNEFEKFVGAEQNPVDKTGF